MYDTASRADHNDYFTNGMASKGMPAQAKAQDSAQVATPMSPLGMFKWLVQRWPLTEVSRKSVCGLASDEQIRKPHLFPTIEAQSKYAALLTPYEEVEITSYPEVYYVGREAAKVWSVPGDSTNNYGVCVIVFFPHLYW